MSHDRPSADRQICVLNTIGQFIDINNIVPWPDVCFYADTLYGNEFGSSLWCRTSLLRMIWCTTNNQFVNWHFLATYTVAVLIETQVKVNC